MKSLYFMYLLALAIVVLLFGAVAKKSKEISAKKTDKVTYIMEAF